MSFKYPPLHLPADQVLALAEAAHVPLADASWIAEQGAQYGAEQMLHGILGYLDTVDNGHLIGEILTRFGASGPVGPQQTPAADLNSDHLRRRSCIKPLRIISG